MGQEVIQGIFLGLSAVICVVLIGVYITMGNTMIIVGAVISAVVFVALWFLFNRGQKQPE